MDTVNPILDKIKQIERTIGISSPVKTTPGEITEDKLALTTTTMFGEHPETTINLTK